MAPSTPLRDGEQVRQHGLGDRDAGGAAEIGGEIGHAEMRNAFVDESRIGQRSGPAGFDASALVDGDVDHSRARLHPFHHGAGHDVRRRGCLLPAWRRSGRRPPPRLRRWRRRPPGRFRLPGTCSITWRSLQRVAVESGDPRAGGGRAANGRKPHRTQRRVPPRAPEARRACRPAGCRVRRNSSASGARRWRWSSGRPFR